MSELGIPSRRAGRVVIVGGGLAGYSAAESLRSLGHDGSITIVDQEPEMYDRPPLSKKLFDEGFSIEAVAFASAQKLNEARIETRVGHAVAAIDPQAVSVILDTGEVIPADTILLATGGRARRLSIPGADAPEVHVLRTFADALSIRASVRPGRRVVVIGGGLIGAELVSSLRQAGAEVTLVDPVPVPMSQALGAVLADYLHDMHALNGVAVRLGAPVRIESSAEGVQVILESGERLPTELVVVGIGIIPNVELAIDAGLDVDDGVLVDEQHRTSAPNIFAVGDVARRRGDDGEVFRREEHWEAAQLGGRAAAAGMLGLPVPARGASWFWSDRHGIHLEVTGRLVGDGELVVRESEPHPSFFLLDEGSLVGAASIDDPNVVRAARRIIDQRIAVTAAELADPSVSLRALLKAGVR